MTTRMPGLQSFLGFSHHFVMAKLATTSISINPVKPVHPRVSDMQTDFFLGLSFFQFFPLLLNTNSRKCSVHLI